MPQDTNLYAGNDSDLVINDLTDDSTGSAITDAVIVANVVPANATSPGTGTSVSGGSNVSIPHVSGGDYLGVLPSTASITAGSSYDIKYTCSNYGFTIVQTKQALVRRP